MDVRFDPRCERLIEQQLLQSLLVGVAVDVARQLRLDFGAALRQCFEPRFELLQFSSQRLLALP